MPVVVQGGGGGGGGGQVMQPFELVLVEDEVEGQGPLAVSSGLKEQEVSRSTEKHVAAAEVVLEHHVVEVDRRLSTR